MRPERIALILIAAVALVGFVVSPALGGPGFLTTKKANKLFLKKRAASRQFLATADAESRFLSKGEGESRFAPKGEAYSRSEADARFLRPEGEIRISSGPTAWVLGPSNAGPKPEVEYFSDSLRLRSDAEASVFAQASPSMPTILYGRPVKVAGAELCYTASSQAQIQFVSLAIITESGKIGIAGVTELAADGTARTDDACRTYAAPSPVALGPADHVVLSVLANYPTKTADRDLFLGRTSFILQP